MLLRSCIFVFWAAPMLVWAIGSMVSTDSPWHGFRLPGLVFAGYASARFAHEIVNLLFGPDAPEPSNGEPEFSEDKQEWLLKSSGPGQYKPQR